MMANELCVDFNVKRRVCDDECKNVNLAVISELKGKLAVVATNEVLAQRMT
jgi:hypothetical protein